MSELSLQDAIERAQRRLGTRRRRRADAGRSRLSSAVETEIARLLSGHAQPRMTDIHRALTTYCQRRALVAPSRSTVYNALRRVVPPVLDRRDLPAAVRRVLHNVAPGPVPGHQIVFAAFNYGDTSAMSFASRLPWLCLHRADELGGWRPKSHALLRAMLHCRGIR